MKNEDFLPNLNIGRMIKEFATQKGIASREVAATIHRYQNNADKIFWLNDMDTEDVIRISYFVFIAI